MQVIFSASDALLQTYKGSFTLKYAGSIRFLVDVESDGSSCGISAKWSSNCSRPGSICSIYFSKLKWFKKIFFLLLSLKWP